MSKLIKELLETEMYKFYLTNYPNMVTGIRKLLMAGESKTKIKRFCERVAGRSMTSSCVGFMIDYVNKQIKN